MVEVMQVLLMNTGVSSVALLFLLFLSRRKSSKSKNERVYLSKDMLKIKEEIAED